MQPREMLCLLFLRLGRPNAHAVENLGLEQQPDDDDVDHAHHSKLHAPGTQVDEETLKEGALAIVNIGQRGTLPQPGTQDHRRQDGDHQPPDRDLLRQIPPEDAAEDAVSGMRDAAFSHMAGDGSISMVDVGSKNITRRVAIVRGAVEMNAHTLGLLKEHALPKGDVLVTAQVAGIMAAKRTSELIPLCHPVPLSFVDVRFEIQDEPPAVLIESEARTSDRTGVEMEAIIAAQVAAATIYDMCKAVDKTMEISGVHLEYKSGGKSGVFINPGQGGGE